MATQGTNVGAIYYEVESDTSKLVNSTATVDGSLDRLNKTFRKTDKAANDTQFAMTKTATAVRGLGRESTAAASNVGGLTKVLGGLLTLRGVGNLIQLAEAYGEMAERIQMATASQEEYEMVQLRLLKTANGTYRSLAEAQEVYIQTADALRSLGYSTEQVLDITDSLSYLFVKNATSVQRSESAMSAYTKAVNKGKVEVDGWESIMAAIPSVVNDIAAAAGMSAKEVRELGFAGKLTANDLNEGLRKSLDSNKAAADGMATTVKDAYTALRNSLSVYVGEANRANGATGVLSGAMVLLANNLDTVVKLLMVAGANVLARYIAQLGTSALASGRAMMATRAHAVEELNLAKAQVAATAASVAQFQGTNRLAGAHGTAAQAATAHAAALARLQAAQSAVVGVGRTLVGVLGGPVGIIALIASAGAAFLTMGGSARSAIPSIDDLTGSIENLTKAQIALRQQQAGELSDTLRKDLIATGREVRGLERDLSALEQMASQGRGVDEAGLSNARKSLVEARAEMDGVSQDLNRVIDLEKQLADAQERSREGASGSGPSQTSDPEVEKRLQAMRDELELAKLTGAARARLQAIQKLGASATDEERAEAERLASEIFRLESAQKAVSGATKKTAEASKENAKVISDLAQDLYQAGLAGEELASVKARLRLNDAATPQEVAQVEALARAIHEVAEAEKNRDLLKGMDPIANEQMKFQLEMENLRKLNEAKLLEDQRYLELKAQAETAHDEQMSALQEENFRRQSDWNDLLIGSLDNLQSAGTNALTGLITGASDGTDVVRGLAQAIMQDAIGALVKMGIQYVKNLVMGKAAEAASTAAGVAMAGTLSAAYAVPAALASLMSFGGNSVPAMAGIASTVALSQGLSLAGGRQYGGPVSGSAMHRINENGRPEILNTASGQQYLLPNSRGEVVSNKDAASGGNSMGNVTVNVIENQERAGEVDRTQADQDQIISVFVADIRGGGRGSRALEQTYGIRRRGS